MRRFKFSACSGLLKSNILKMTRKSSLRYVGNTFHLSPSKWRPLGDSNPCYRRERAVSWASRRRGREILVQQTRVVSREGEIV